MDDEALLVQRAFQCALKLTAPCQREARLRMTQRRQIQDEYAWPYS